MAELSSFFDANMVNGVPDRQYDATAWANYFSGFIGNGVSNSPANNLQVTAGTGLSVIVDSGIGYINGYYYNNTEPLTININTANATYPRITSIVIELNLNNREITCKTIDGNAQSNPTAPQITQTESTYQLQLATIYIPAGATNIGTITDTRSNSSVCGWVNVLVPAENTINELAPILQGYFMGNNMAMPDGKYLTDFNTAVTNGYYTYASSQGTKHIPPDCAYGVVAVIVGNGGTTFTGNGNWIWQIAYDTSGIVIYRLATGGDNWNWGEWNQLITAISPTITTPTINNGTISEPIINGGQIWNAEIGNCKTIDNLTVKGAVDLLNVLTCQGGTAGINFTTTSGKYQIGIGADGPQDAFILMDNTNGNTLWEYNPATTTFTLVDTTLKNANIIETMTVNAPVIIGNENGEIFFQNANNENMIAFNPDNTTFQLKNVFTNNNIFTVTPVTAGTDTLKFFADVKFTQPLTIPSTSGINAITPTTHTNLGWGPYAIDGDEYVGIWNNTSNTFVTGYNLTNNQLEFDVPLHSPTIDNPTIQAFGNNIVQYNSFNYSTPVGVNSNGAQTNATGTVEFFLINGYQLGGNNIGGAIGIITITTTLDQWYIWPESNKLTINVPGIPSATGNTLSPNNVVQFGIQENTLYLYGTGQALDDNVTYTTKGIIWQ